MTTQNTLLAHIVPMYGKTELVATEALRYILEQSEAARKALESMLRASGVEVGSLTRFTTEEPGDGGERVDVVCSDADGAKRVLIEAKFWARLTDHQPNTYLGSLPKDKPSVLLFVTPEARLSSLWQEILVRADNRFNVTPIDEAKDLRKARLGDGPAQLMQTSWRYLLGQIELQLSSGDKALEDVRQLRGLTERMDIAPFLPLQAGEISQDLPRRMLSLRRLVDEAMDRMEKQGWMRPDNKRPTRDDTFIYYGRMVDFAGTRAWFGVNLETWAEWRNTPILIELYSSEQLPETEASNLLLNKIGQHFPGEGADDNWHVPIFLPVGVEFDTVVDTVVKRLEFIGNLVDANGPTYV